MRRFVKRASHFVFGAITVMALSVASVANAQANGQATPIDQMPASRVSIVGAVANPGTFLYNGNMMLKEVFAAVGGFTKDADRDSIVVMRGMLIDPSKAQKIQYDYDKVLKGKAPDIPLLSGDMVEVPERRGKRNLLSQVTSGLKRLPSALLDNSTGLLLSTPILSKAVGGLGSLLGIGDDNEKAANGQTIGVMGSTQVGGGDASNFNRPPTPLEATLIQAIAAESPEVRERILSRVLAALQIERR